MINDMRAGRNTHRCLKESGFEHIKNEIHLRGEILLVNAPGHMVVTSKGTKTKAYNLIFNSSFD